MRIGAITGAFFHVTIFSRLSRQLETTTLHIIHNLCPLIAEPEPEVEVEVEVEIA